MSKNTYLERYIWPQEALPKGFDSNPDMIVVIPCYNEPNISKALNALHSCYEPPVNVAVLVVVNQSELAEPAIHKQNKFSVHQANSVPTKYEQQVIQVDLPKKHAGVGLARKIGMDEAVRCFEQQQKDGIIICYDADCTCRPDYLQSIWTNYDRKKLNLGLVHYEHDLDGPNEEGIINYELYLRYYNNGLRVADYPFAVQTLGSCITVRSSVYQKQGGMNRRKAGEDFYFIHKCMPLGAVGEINDTCIYPSDRISDRVPFGTGHAINRYLEDRDESYPVYHYSTFEDLKHININLNDLWKTGTLTALPESIVRFYSENSFDDSLRKIRDQAGSMQNFKQRYYAWWDGFRVLKFIHFCRDHHYQKIPLTEALNWLDDQLMGLDFKRDDKRTQLEKLRRFDQQQDFYVKL